MPEYHVKLTDHKASCNVGFQCGVRVQVRAQRNLEQCTAM
jgi:hypothetical protein